MFLCDFRIFTPDVLEEHSVARTKVVEALHSRGAGRGTNRYCNTGAECETLDETVLGTATKAEVCNIAVEADGGEAVDFVFAEAAVGLHHVVQRAVHNVAHKVFGEHLTVATV